MLDLPWSSGISKDPLLLVDAIELLVAFDRDTFRGSFTRADFLHWVAMEDIVDEDAQSGYVNGDMADERNESYEQAIAIAHLRAMWLGEKYPFVVEHGELRLADYATSSQGVSYLFLLICANREFVPSLRQRIPTEFEYLCREAFRSLFPGWADVKLFSKDSDDRRDFFGRSAKQAIPALATMLNASVKDADRIPDTPREFGIDLVAVCSFPDRVPYSAFAFAQCTVAKEWWEKRDEARASRELTGFVDLNAEHLNFLMIPHFPRYNGREWSVDPAHTGNCILCDRLRLCVLLDMSEFLRNGNVVPQLEGVLGIIRASLGVEDA